MRKHILLIDDDPIVSKVTDKILNHIGFQTTCVINGSEGVNTFKQTPETYDLIILDKGLPDMDGTDCFLQLKEINSEVKVLLTSGIIKDDAIHQLEENHNLTGFIHKPYSMKDLKEVLNDIFCCCNA